MKEIDCLIIGHNEMDFASYEESIRKMGSHTNAYRDLNLSFIQYNNKPYHATEIYNEFASRNTAGTVPAQPFKPLSMSESFSATVSYLATYLDKRGLTFDYVLSFQDEKEELGRKLAQENILTIAVTTTYYVSVFPIMEILGFIRTFNRSAKIIIGGPFISSQVRMQDPEVLEFILKSIDADFYVNSSQGEGALVNIIKCLKEGRPVDGVNKVNNVFCKVDDDYVAAPVSKENNRLAEEMVNWGLFADRVGEYVNVRTAISCPFSCAFCGSPEHAGAYQTLSVEDIETEFNQLAGIESLRNIHFIEDTLNVPVDRYKKILRMMIKNKYKFSWHSYFRCQYADREMVELMKESKCEGVYLGLESGSNQILKNMNKAATVEKYLEGISLLNEYGILTHGNFIVGFPGETHETVQETVKLIRESGIDFFRVQLWYCMPITPIWNKREEYDIKGKSFEWSHRTMDSRMAADLVERIFLEVKEVTWVPQYNFDINNLFHMLHRGMSLSRVKDFLNGFNNGIREKLVNPGQREIGANVLEQLTNACAPARR